MLRGWCKNGHELGYARMESGSMIPWQAAELLNRYPDFSFLAPGPNPWLDCARSKTALEHSYMWPWTSDMPSDKEEEGMSDNEESLKN
eukprot:586672-Amphidinium_carterae.2